MNPLRSIRKRRRPLVTQLLAMLGVVWLNMVLQPCLMAAEMGMDMDMDMTGPCPHCPASMTDDCDGPASDGCTYVDSVDYDGRSPHSKPAKRVDHGFAMVAAFPAPCSRPASHWATGPPRDADPHLPALPINVLYCVYLN